jgi:hypothetical protein
LNELYHNGFINADSGLCYGFFVDDSDYFVSVDIRKFDSYKPEWVKEKYKEPQELNRKSDILSRYLSDRIRVDLTRVNKENRDIVDIPDDIKRVLCEELEKTMARFFESQRKAIK